MNTFLQRVFAPGDGTAPEVSLALEGWPPPWILGLALAAMLLTWLGYRWGGEGLSAGRRRLLTALRAAFFVLLLVLLARPVILLTVNEPLRGSLVVLVDDSASMAQKDRRTEPDDLRRAAIATGALAPGDTTTAPPAAAPATRLDLLRSLTLNERLDLWARLHAQADLAFHAFSTAVRPLGTIGPDAPPAPAREVARLLGPDRLAARGTATAAGDALRQLLEETRGQTASGILLITDGANNSGSAPEEAAALAKDAGIPLFIYGTGIAAPRDIVLLALNGPRGVFKKEFIEYTARVRATGYAGRKVKLRLEQDGRTVQEKEVTLAEGAQDLTIGYTPQDAGTFPVTASLSPLPDEASPDNNASGTRLRVLDDRLDVLYVEQEPRWDFRYLLATLERDPRLRVQCLLLDGDPIPPDREGRPFLKNFPETRAQLVNNAVIILGDVHPVELGEARMKLMREWVGELGGAIIFLSGPKNAPFRYTSTPLEPLLPVEINPTLREEGWKARSRTPIALALTPAGEVSPLLRLDPDRGENRRLWAAFPGVRWTARVSRARPGAQVLVEDTVHSGAEGRLPVIATMPYGQGAVLYFGFDETYRWRSRTGERHYTAIWNQIIQQFAIDRRLAASPRIQLQADRLEVPVGSRNRIAGRLFDETFRPLVDDSVPATLRIRQPGGRELPPRAVRLLAIPGRPGEYELEVAADREGTYTLTTALDPAAPAGFEVRNPPLELAETAMDEAGLRALAQLSGGAFFREETLHTLPDAVKSRRATLPVVKKLEPAYSAWWPFLLLALLAAEWALRRLWSLR